MDIEAVFPEIDGIEDEALGAGVVAAWTSALDDAGLEVEDLPEVPWSPLSQRAVGLAADEALLVDHVRDVVACALGLAEALTAEGSDSGPDVDLDTVLAGALVHDVSKVVEYDGMEHTAVGELLGHPYYGVTVALRADLPLEIAHVVLSHSPNTNVEPATLEAELVKRGDEAAAASIRAGATEDLRNA
jgi:hypothetical protein